MVSQAAIILNRFYVRSVFLHYLQLFISVKLVKFALIFTSLHHSFPSRCS